MSSSLLPLDAGRERALTRGQTAKPGEEPPWQRGAGYNSARPQGFTNDKKGALLPSGNTPLRNILRPEDVAVSSTQGEAPEGDAMGRLVGQTQAHGGGGTPVSTGPARSWWRSLAEAARKGFGS